MSECAGLAVPYSTFWAATQSLSRAELAAIPPMKEEMQGFHMTPIAEIFLGKNSPVKSPAALLV